MRWYSADAERKRQRAAAPHRAADLSESIIQVVQAQAARLADTAALFQALGGGWWNRVEAPTEKILDVGTSEAATLARASRP